MSGQSLGSYSTVTDVLFDFDISCHTFQGGISLEREVGMSRGSMVKYDVKMTKH